MPPHRRVCRRHRLWIGPAARSHASQLDISQLRHHPWRLVDIAVIDATHTIHQALRAEAWTPRQRQHLRQLIAGT